MPDKSGISIKRPVHVFLLLTHTHGHEKGHRRRNTSRGRTLDKLAIWQSTFRKVDSFRPKQVNVNRKSHFLKYHFKTPHGSKSKIKPFSYLGRSSLNFSEYISKQVCIANLKEGNAQTLKAMSSFI